MNVQSEAAAQLAHFFMMLAGDGHTTWACGVPGEQAACASGSKAAL